MNFFKMNRNMLALVPKSGFGHRGFTIVELLIVIVVIGILAAITIVAYQNITVQANQKAALSNAKAVREAARTYYAEYGTYPSVASSTISGGTYSVLPSSVVVTATGPISANNNTVLYGIEAGNAGICVGYFPVGGSFTVVYGGSSNGSPTAFTNVASPTCT